MKKYLVIGNPIEHSLSPKLHNYWIKQNNINASYEKKLISENDIGNIISKVKSEEIAGINVTVPFKNKTVPFVDILTKEADQTKSINTIYFEKGKTIGHNTDIAGFELGIRSYGYNIEKKNIFILGAGGVVPSIIVALKKMKALNIFLHNRTLDKAEALKDRFNYIKIIENNEIPKHIDMIINATSLGINKDDKIDLDYEKIGSNKFYYDIIYNPPQTNFLKQAKIFGNNTENGKMMFIYQAHQAFSIWHKVFPKIDEKVIELLDK